MTTSGQECGSLSHLYLAQNLFEEAPTLDRPLQFIDLSSNRLRNASALASNVAEVLLQDNQLSEISAVLLSPALRSIKLARNHFRFLTLGRQEPLDGQHLEVTSNLELLDISENHLTQIEDGLFAAFPRLKILRLSRNRLRSLSFPSQSLPDLQILELEENELEYLPCAGRPQVVNARQNRVKVLKALPCLAKTRMLDLSYNQLQSARLEILSTELLALHLANNELQWLPNKLPQALQVLDLSHNPLHPPSRLHPHRLPPLPALLTLLLRNVSLHFSGHQQSPQCPGGEV
eukprot:symbB.v1.2.017700.t1/scaffold1385.1/size122333/9